MTTMPLNSQNNLFCVKILSLGSWIGIGTSSMVVNAIGVGDTRFKLSGSNVLGAQEEGLNSSYFWQGNIRKIQLFGSKEITEGILPIATGDIIGRRVFEIDQVVVQVNFQDNKILYYNNDLFQGAISPKLDIKLEENKIFPCVNLSNSSEVMLINQPL